MAIATVRGLKYLCVGKGEGVQDPTVIDLFSLPFQYWDLSGSGITGIFFL